MRRAVLAALTAAALGAAGASVAARAQAPSLPAPTSVAPGTPNSGTLLDPTPSARTPAPLTPARAPTTPTSLVRKRPFAPPAPAPAAPSTPADTSSPSSAATDPGVAALAPPTPGFDPRLCGRGGLTPTLAEACRNDFMRKVEADRARIEARREADRLAREARAARRAPQLTPRPAQLDFFFAERLSYGDVVMTDKGARVYIGKSDNPPRREDFVPLDDPRSPRRELPARLKRAPRGL
jgi:hypothetical protein